MYVHVNMYHVQLFLYIALLMQSLLYFCNEKLNYTMKIMYSVGNTQVLVNVKENLKEQFVDYLQILTKKHHLIIKQ